jgi:hypothetical protein
MRIVAERPLDRRGTISPPIPRLFLARSGSLGPLLSSIDGHV